MDRWHTAALKLTLGQLVAGEPAHPMTGKLPRIPFPTLAAYGFLAGKTSRNGCSNVHSPRY